MAMWPGTEAELIPAGDSDDMREAAIVANVGARWQALETHP